jgi:hypothetical protein
MKIIIVAIGSAFMFLLFKFFQGLTQIKSSDPPSTGGGDADILPGG